MAKPRKSTERSTRLAGLYAAGDHGAARRLASELLADAGASEEERAAASDVAARTAPERGAVVAGICGLVGAVVISFWLVLH